MPAAAKLTLPPADAERRRSRGALRDKRRRSNWNAPPRCPPYPRNGRPSAEETPALKETKSPAPEETSQSRRRRLMRRGLFALLPFALIAGAYWYVTGGQLMSTDDAYVAGRHGRHLDRRVRHRPGGRGRQQSAHRSGAGFVSPRSPAVPNCTRQRQGQPRADGDDHRRDEAGLYQDAQRRRRPTGAGRTRPGDL